MSNQFPKSFESVRGAVIAFLRSCDPHMEKLRDRQLLTEEINRLRGKGGALGTGLKHTGITRNIDDLGRIVIPKELRRSLGIDSEGATVEIFYDDDARTVIFQKYNFQKCGICDSDSNLTPIKGRHICEDCISKVFEGEE